MTSRVRLNDVRVRVLQCRTCVSCPDSHVATGHTGKSSIESLVVQRFARRDDASASAKSSPVLRGVVFQSCRRDRNDMSVNSNGKFDDCPVQAFEVKLIQAGTVERLGSSRRVVFRPRVSVRSVPSGSSRRNRTPPSPPTSFGRDRAAGTSLALGRLHTKADNRTRLEIVSALAGSSSCERDHAHRNSPTRTPRPSPRERDAGSRR